MERDNSLDTVRGIACILLVLYHVVGGNSNSGLRLDEGDPIQTFNIALGVIRMPLFTFLSGVVYALRPIVPPEGMKFATGKFKRLLLPFVCVSLIFSISQKIMPGTNAKLDWHEIPLVLVWPYAHLWFIAALAIVFVVVGVLDYLQALGKPLHLVMLFLTACALFQFHQGPVGVLAWNRGLYLLPFFVGGVFVKRFGWHWGVICALLALVLTAWQVTAGIIFAIALLRWMPNVPWLARIGVYSYTIYLFHVFATAGSRIILENLGVQTIFPSIVIGTLTGLLVPILFHRLVAPVPYLSRALLGVGRRVN